ncbi:hypothetical protein pah_c173o032 [Parachlamydia acanthamoebae str. Hall's coccus]|nr:hypothetical protein pah_c173o032 [Parachlamydia acanthamoebae str. Hall's coccus]
MRSTSTASAWGTDLEMCDYLCDDLRTKKSLEDEEASH